ncbi:MAG: prepilin peptidase [Clostridia bacterium]|nr:prepilin peptidase [Clostridia bacterium]
MISKTLTLMVLCCAAAEDIRRREFPNYCQLLMLLIYPLGFQPEKLWGMLVSAPFFVLAFKNGKMGMGDAKATLLLGGLTGLPSMLATVVIGCMAFIIYGKARGVNAMAFIPFLVFGYGVIYILEVFIA